VLCQRTRRVGGSKASTNLDLSSSALHADLDSGPVCGIGGSQEAATLCVLRRPGYARPLGAKTPWVMSARNLSSPLQALLD
jgi:hypothetical protein